MKSKTFLHSRAGRFLLKLLQKALNTVCLVLTIGYCASTVWIAHFRASSGQLSGPDFFFFPWLLCRAIASFWRAISYFEAECTFWCVYWNVCSVWLMGLSLFSELKQPPNFFSKDSLWIYTSQAHLWGIFLFVHLFLHFSLEWN